MVKNFNTHKVPINARLLKFAYPMIAQKYGEDQELVLEFEFKRPRVQFGMTDADMTGSVTMKLGIKLAGDYNYILFDEFDIYTEGDIAVEEEVLLGAMEVLTIQKAEFSDQDRVKPMYDTLDFTETEYIEFWEFMDGSAQRWQNFFNKVLAAGIPLPYWNLEFLSKFTFHPHAMLVVMDVFYNQIDGLSK